MNLFSFVFLCLLSVESAKLASVHQFFQNNFCMTRNDPTTFGTYEHTFQ